MIPYSSMLISKGDSSLAPALPPPRPPIIWLGLLPIPEPLLRIPLAIAPDIVDDIADAEAELLEPPPMLEGMLPTGIPELEPDPPLPGVILPPAPARWLGWPIFTCLISIGKLALPISASSLENFR